MISDEFFMKRAMELALRGVGHVSPNPRVGSVITLQNEIIGEGFHARYGDHHAEVMAINSVAREEVLSESTLYVNLEPCSHHGKTPPCADLIIRKKIKRVVISNIDCNPLVSGKGIQRLKDAGIRVDVGVCKQEGYELNKRFFLSMEKKRPYVILKWAQTKDGFIAEENGDSRWISNEHSRQLVHRWRSEEDAILVGTTTAQVDNPSLTVRDWKGKNPLRVVIDRNLRLTENLNLFDGLTPTVCYTTQSKSSKKNIEFVKINESGFIEDLLGDLNSRGIQSLIIEGGTQTINSFTEKKLWDEARVFKSDLIFGKGIDAPKGFNNLVSSEDVRGDSLEIYRP